MPQSNYPNGFPQGVSIKGVPIVMTNPGKIVWLGNATTLQTGDRGASDGNSGTAGSPYSTLAGAFSKCTAGRGDIIIVKPGHSETITSATALALATAGVAVIGLGWGSARPKFTISTANTATIAVSADNISFTNCQFFANFLSIAACFTLSTAKNFTLQNCSFTDTSSVLNFLNIVKSTGAANTVDGLTILDCSWNGLGTTSVNSFILSANDIDGAVWQRNNVKLARTATAAVFATITAGVLTNLVCGPDNVAISQQVADTGGGFISVGGTTSTGVVYRNMLGDLSTTDLFVTTNVGLTFFDNRKTGVITASGYLLPATDS
jgi:hypothetical protein